MRRIIIQTVWTFLLVSYIGFTFHACNVQPESSTTQQQQKNQPTSVDNSTFVNPAIQNQPEAKQLNEGVNDIVIITKDNPNFREIAPQPQNEFKNNESHNMSREFQDSLGYTLRINNNFIEFINPNGELKQKITLEHKVLDVTKKLSDENKRHTRIQYSVSNSVTYNNSANLIAITENRIEKYVDDSGHTLSGEKKATGNIKIFDITGYKLAELTLSNGKGISYNPKISNEGKAIAFIVYDSTRQSTLSTYQLMVINESGQVIFKTPLKEEIEKYKKFNIIDILSISPNGLYVAFNVSYGVPAKRVNATRIYNLNNLKFIEMQNQYPIYHIDNDGYAYLSDQNSAPINVNVKQYIGGM